MKTFLLCLLLAVSAIALHAQPATPRDYQPTLILNTFPGNLLTTGTSTNGNNTNGPAYDCGVSKYHTFQIVMTNASGTNCSTFLDRSLDATNWIPFYTNTGTSAATNDTTLTGKWAYFRARFTGTNASAVVSYLGGN